VVGQLTLSFTLLAGAALLVRSLLNLTAVDPGFETESVLTVQSPSSNFGVTQADEPLFQQALDEIRARPGVRSAAVASWVPLAAETPVAWGVRVEGEAEQGDRTNLVAFNDVSTGFFETIGVPLVAGRYLDNTDLEESEPVVVINQSMAAAHFGDTNPVGRRLSFSFNGQNWSDWERVVGVVADAQEHGIGREGVHTVYRPASQGSWGPAIIVASDSDPAPLAFEVRDVIHGIEPDRAVDQVRTLADLRAEDVAPSRLNAMLFGSFAGLALAIAAVGVLGTLGFSVSQRMREFGIRMALGADRSRVLGSVLGEGLLLLGVALVAGVAGAVALGRVLSGLLFAVDPVDPTSLVGAAVVLSSPRSGPYGCTPRRRSAPNRIPAREGAGHPPWRTRFEIEPLIPVG
jgi:predicted permease